MLADLRTEDSGKLGCRLIGPEGERSESLKDFAVTGDVTFFSIVIVCRIFVGG